MIIFFAGADSGINRKILLRAGVKNALISFFYSRGKQLENLELFEKLFIDSGGYTARVRNINIDVREYGKWIIEKGFKYYANLDMNTTEETLKNQAILEEMGLNPIPVYHYGEFARGDRQLLRDYMKKSPYIAIGGIAGSTGQGKKMERFFDFIFSETRDKIKVHGFGITRMDLLERYPFFSCDSTSWNRGGRYNQVIKFKNGRIDNYGMNDFKGLHYEERDVKNATEYLKLQDYITELWKDRGVVWTI